MENEKFYGPSISFRINDDLNSQLKDNYQSLSGTDKLLSMKDFFNLICEKALESLVLREELISYRTDLQTVTSEKTLISEKLAAANLDLEKSNLLKDKIVLLTGENNNLSDKLNEYANEVQRLTTLLEDAERNNEHLSSENQSKQLTGNQILLNMTDVELEMLNVVISNEKEKYKKDITPEQLIKKLFNKLAINGTCDVFDKIEDSVLKQILSKFK